MSATLKILIGIILMVGVVWMEYASMTSVWGISFPLWANFVAVLEGVVPPLVFLIGLFVVWLEIDEMKIEKELKVEEQKEKAKKPARPRKK